MKKRSSRYIFAGLLFIFISILAVYMFAYLYRVMDDMADGPWYNVQIQAFMQLIILFIVMLLGMLCTVVSLYIRNSRLFGEKCSLESTIRDAYGSIERLNEVVSTYRTLDVQRGAWSLSMFDVFIQAFKDQNVWEISILKVVCEDDRAANTLCMNSKFVLGTDVLRFEENSRTFIYVFPGCSVSEAEMYLGSVLAKRTKITKSLLHDTLVDDLEVTKGRLGIGNEGAYALKAV